MSRRSLKEPPPEEQPFPVRGYLVINLLFYGFLFLVFGSAYVIQRGEVTGLVPVIVGLGFLFTIVTIYDALFDRHLFRRHLREAESPKDELAEEGKLEAGSAVGAAIRDVRNR